MPTGGVRSLAGLLSDNSDNPSPRLAGMSAEILIARGRWHVMRTKRQVLLISNADGTIGIVPMRYDASHQAGWRCFIGTLAEDAAAISEETVPSFHGRSLFDALAMFRATIEPGGARLLHAMASGECWKDTGTYDRFCRRFALGSEATELIDGFLPIGPEEAVTLEEQRVRYDAWRMSLPMVAEPRVAPGSRARQALNDTNAAIRAAREAAILARGDLAPGEGS